MKSYLFLVCLSIATLANGVASQNLLKRIIGGKDVSNIPYQVSLRHSLYDSHFCSGVILSNEWILTTARCIGNYDAPDIEVFYGSRRLSELNQVAEVDTIFVHQDFNAETLENDIALILLEKPLELKAKSVESIALPTRVAIDGEVVTVTGWGMKEVRLMMFFFS